MFCLSVNTHLTFQLPVRQTPCQSKSPGTVSRDSYMSIRFAWWETERSQCHVISCQQQPFGSHASLCTKPKKINGHATNGHFAQPLTMFIYNSKLKISTANSIAYSAAYSLKNVEPYTSQQTLVQHWSEYSIRRFHWKAVHFLELHTSLTLFMATHRCFSVKHSPLIETGLSFAFPRKSKCNLASAPKEIERH